MKQLINFEKKFFLLLTLFTILISLNNCKLKLNNPKDPMSQSFMETWLWESYLNSLCSPNLQGTIRLGSGAGQVYSYDLLKLKNGNLVVFGAAGEALLWNGSNTGKNYSYTVGSQFFVALINGKNFQIEWLDYLGVTGSSFNSGISHTTHLAEFANGDFVVKAYVNSGQNLPTPISEKYNEDSMFFVRFDQNGNRIWQTYLDKSNEALDDAYSSIVVDQKDNVHFFFGTLSPYSDTIGFVEFAPPEQTSLGGSIIETGWAIINGNGNPIRQKYIVGDPNITVSIRSAVLGPFQNILLSGVTTGNIAGFSGHPYPNNGVLRPFTINLSAETFATTNVSYLGSNDQTQTNVILTSLISGEDGFFGGGFYPGNFGNPILPAATDGFRSFLFFKTDWLGNPLWHTFVSTENEAVSDVFPSISFMSGNQFRAKLLGPETNKRYSSLGQIENGPGTNENQSLTVRLDQSGKFTKAYYETNATGAAYPVGLESKACEVCQGRLVRLDTVIQFPSMTRYVEISTRPVSEEP
ncbi:hypothetical protein EHQ16_13420 [Leptospira kanakyensis]|uniref:Uncharacterized protein n=1 Tax=Leptospira kanakyensis TaxID=2484968 RepID=A0A6N4Q9C4_9LEPT|nr:hypothetical protein [Leptospira kanakyensis]TGK49903.1 hypothetical protein EHQ11_09200 [Leptospira kanakyensis]TGK58580.1 hypothetical protein EHQ16_13420 [Leptospira kanakyensis]TGK69041.1 hypothetical protein EHQ18_09360 [Leptospira kanakyensis]